MRRPTSERVSTGTKPGDRIGFGSTVRGDQAQLWVEATGVGIARHDQLHIFERFGRGSTAPGLRAPATVSRS